jgi:hypothetical protein
MTKDTTTTHAISTRSCYYVKLKKKADDTNEANEPMIQLGRQVDEANDNIAGFVGIVSHNSIIASSTWRPH